MTERRFVPQTLPEPEARKAGVARVIDPRLVLIGLAGGLLSGLLGVGGGTIMVPLLVYAASYRQREAHAMALGAIIPISIVSVTTFGIAGKVHLGDALALCVGSIIGAQVGARLLAQTDERRLKLAFGFFLVATAILMAVRG